MASPLQPNSQRNLRNRGSVGSIIVLLVLVTASVLVWWNRQFLVDLIAYWQYQPTSSVATIADRNQLTDGGKFLFYASKPSIDGKSAFNKVCERKESNTAILGCYSGAKIYLYDVTDAKLDGIKEVTAAHEMLHAVYERLSPPEKKTIDGLVETEYQKLKSNASYAERMAFYERTEPGERDNELHSIIGTEVSSISPELEAHYAKYFKDRSKIIGYYNAYNDTFTNLSNQAKQLASQLDAINAEIKSASGQYNADVKQLNSDIATFNSRAGSSGGFSSQAAFNRERQALVERVDSVSNERTAINNLVSKYNTLSDQYNSIVTQSNDLYKSIDSTLAPPPRV